MRRLKRLTIGVLAMSVVLVVALTVCKTLWDARYYRGYDRALPLNVILREDKPFPDDKPKYRRIAFRFEGLAGQAVPAVAAFPLDAQGPSPCLVFLHGIGQEKEFLDEIAVPFVEAGFVIVSFDQYMRGERKLKGTGKLAGLLAFRRRGALTVIETRRLLDYLHTRNDIAHDRIYLLGASYGAITGSTAAAFDDRIRAAVLCYGGGKFRYLLNNEEAAEMMGALAGPAKAFLTWLLAPSDPVQHVAAISPRPVLLQNGTHDSVIGRPAAQALHAAAAEPKEVIWYDSDHVGLDQDHTWKVIHDAINWVKKQDEQLLRQ
jgi:dienelactone hydrolase